jgi:MutS domain V/MutS domain III
VIEWRAMTPRELYAERWNARQSDADALKRRESRLSAARMISIAAAIGLLFWSVAAAVIPLIVFVVLVIVHEKTVRDRQRAESRAAFYEDGLERVEERWAGGGDGGKEFEEEHHPYASDFDLFGKGSLFELISLATTRAGRVRLARWLKEPAREIAEIRSRQEAVAELRENVDLREDLSVVAQLVAKEVESARLEEWSRMPAVVVAKWERIAAIAVPSLCILFLMASIPEILARFVGESYGIPLWPLAAVTAVSAWLSRRLHPRTEPIVIGVERAEPALALLTGLLARIERESFASPRLSSLLARLRGADSAASAEIEKLRRLVALLDARRNQFFFLFAMLLVWTPNVALAIERWRLRSGSHAADWIEVAGEIEALSSLASFAFEHPSFAMPEAVAEGPLFEARELGHPLIPADRRITNDLRLDSTLRLLVVSGSNMSGKSTMMRSAGIAAVLAMAGGPVCARSLRIAPMAVGASIRIHDSLQENASRFYAEILRIRQVLDLARSGPLLFLLDEVLAGTNSHDRRIGAEAIVRSLVERGAVGLVSTHDLALAKIADELAPRAANVHFEDHLEGGRVVFDYRMRPGVVTKSNALELMRSVGIEV